MLEIRWHGRGGQGVVTAAKLLAASALREGKYFQAFPEYGPERRGAPVQAFTRIDDEPVRVFAHIAAPDVVVVLDETLLGKVPVADGLREAGTVVANFRGTPAQLREKLGLKNGHVFTVDASRIASETLGKPITNTPMIGALLRAVSAVQLDNVVDELAEKFKGAVATSNVSAVRRAYEEVRGE
ncbi:MAG: 2-oxoacid:acceptor oxidoreductase family protein [Chloroflexi bacterium]|nr:2-oxoacid:acceptor oxidoreductase family protein [Chloroflexota bacterium]